MATLNCWLQDANVQKQLEDYFADVDRGLSTFYETNPDTAEPQLDGHLAARLEKEDVSSLELHLERIKRERISAGLKPLRLSFNIRHITSGEVGHGADIGLLLRLELPGEYTLTKAVIVQAKRLYPNTRGTFSENSAYHELFKQGKIPQWERMLNHTPASVYFFYNPHQVRIKQRIQTIGTRVIPAQHIAGIAQHGVKNFTALDAYQRGKPLAKWFVEDFICCNVGDTRENTINIASGRNYEFPVRSTIEIIIEGGTINSQLWDR